MKPGSITAAVLALAGNAIAAPSTMSESSLENMGLMKRDVSAAQCLKFLCCRNKRDLSATESLQHQSAEAQATCLVCWKFGICGQAVRERPTKDGSDRAGRVRVEINQNIINNHQNFQNGGFWIQRGGREYWVDNNGQYWEWMGNDGDWDGGRREQFRMGGHGHVEKGRGGKWHYVFLD
ncbi:hypothetical protein CDD83_10936 [Cordyceps sp. RAO-2017]|nr:hypothetical protein CDD83_10936 [Cordyceps sp. RAO-2017]